MVSNKLVVKSGIIFQRNTGYDSVSMMVVKTEKWFVVEKEVVSQVGKD